MDVAITGDGEGWNGSGEGGGISIHPLLVTSPPQLFSLGNAYDSKSLSRLLQLLLEYGDFFKQRYFTRWCAT